MQEEASELSPPALGAGGGVARPGACWAHVTLTQTDGKSGWKCSFYQKEFAGMNHTRVSSYRSLPQALFIVNYFIFCNRDLSALSLSLAQVVQHLTAVNNQQI
jgi:hypothetical protein